MKVLKQKMPTIKMRTTAAIGFHSFALIGTPLPYLIYD